MSSAMVFHMDLSGAPIESCSDRSRHGDCDGLPRRLRSRDRGRCEARATPLDAVGGGGVHGTRRVTTLRLSMSKARAGLSPSCADQSRQSRKYAMSQSHISSHCKFNRDRKQGVKSKIRIFLVAICAYRRGMDERHCALPARRPSAGNEPPLTPMLTATGRFTRPRRR
jgi:hypothetical protein